MPVLDGLKLVQVGVQVGAITHDPHFVYQKKEEDGGEPRVENFSRYGG